MKKAKMEDSLNQAVAVVPAAEEEEVEEDVEKEDPFKRMPDEVLTSHIFNKITDAESLCRLSMVFKRFANLVPKTRTQYVSVKLPGDFGCFEGLDYVKTDKKNFHSHLHLSAPFSLCWVKRWFGSMQERYGSSSAAHPITRFLRKFECLGTLHWEYDPSHFLFEPVLKWKILITPSKSVCIMLLTAWCLDCHCADIDEVNKLEHYLRADMRKFLNLEYLVSLKHPILDNLLESPQNVLVIDSEEQGRVHIQRNDFVELRKHGLGGFGGSCCRIRFWHSRVLEMPLSGCVLKKATLHLLQNSKTEEDDDDAFLIAKQAFEGEGGELLAEAALAMVKEDVFYDAVLREEVFVRNK